MRPPIIHNPNIFTNLRKPNTPQINSQSLLRAQCRLHSPRRSARNCTSGSQRSRNCANCDYANSASLWASGERRRLGFSLSLSLLERDAVRSDYIGLLRRLALPAAIAAAGPRVISGSADKCDFEERGLDPLCETCTAERLDLWIFF